MGGEGPVVDKKWTVLVLANKLRHLTSHALLKLLARLSGEQRYILHVPRIHVAMARAGHIPTGNVQIEAVILGGIGRKTDMPFAEMRRGIAGLAQELGVGREFRVQTRGRTHALGPRPGWPGAGQPGLEDFLARMPDRGVEAGALRIKPGQQACPRGRTARVGCIGMDEAHAARGQAVNVRRLKKRAAKRAGITPAQIVGKDKNDVRFRRFRALLRFPMGRRGEGQGGNRGGEVARPCRAGSLIHRTT